MSARASRPPALRYRPARRTDLESLMELGYRTYRVRTLESRREFYTEHPRFGFRDVRVGELDGELVASLVLPPFRAWIRGQAMPVTGISAVAVSPEHRRRGIAEALVRACLRELRHRGDAWCMLYSFRAEFYRRFGFGLIERPHLVSVPPALLPASPEARRVRKLRLPDRPHVQALYDRHCAERGHFALARGAAWWERRLWTHDGDWVVYERERGRIEGYLQYQVDAGDGPWKLVLTVNECVAMTPAAQRGLWGYLNGLRDQAVEVIADVPADGAWLSALGDAANLRGELKLGPVRASGAVGYGAMLRVIDVKAGLEALPVAPHARGEIVLELSDELLPANARAWRVHARDGRLAVRAGTARDSGARARLPRLVASPESLASVVAGQLSPAVAAEAGFVESVRGAAEVVEPWFQARPAFLHLFNGF